MSKKSESCVVIVRKSGRVVIPEGIRDVLGIREGNKLRLQVEKLE